MELSEKYPFRLDKLEVKSFRGIYEEILNFDKKSFILYGENGTGKSSFINALEFLFTSKVSFLKTPTDINDKVAIINNNGKAEDLCVRATFKLNTKHAEDEYIIERTYKKLHVDPELEEFYNELNNGGFLLNRQKLLRFINATNSKRYDAIAELCGFNDIDNLEKKLSSINTGLNSDILSKKNEADLIIIKIAKLLEIDFEAILKEFKKYLKNNSKEYEYKTEFEYTLANINNYFNYEINQGIKSLESTSKLSYDLDGIEVIYDIIISKINDIITPKGYKKITRETNFEEYYKLFKSVPPQEKIKEFNKNLNYMLDKALEFYSTIPLEEILGQFDEISSNQLKSSYQLLNIVKDSKTYLDDSYLGKCPICNNEINSSEISIELADKISELEKNIGDFNDLKLLINELNEDLNYLLVQFKEIKNHFGELTTVSENFGNTNVSNTWLILNSVEAVIEEIINDLDDLTQFNILTTQPIKNKFLEIINYIENLKEYISDYCKDLLSNEEILSLNLISNILYELNDNSKFNDKIAKLLNYKNYSKVAYDTFTDLKKDYVANVLEDIEKDVNVFYKDIHGDDVISSPNFNVTGSKKVQLLINSFNEENNVDPRSYSSEGHLDTLGLCIFLAFIKRNSKIPLIVLDDIVATVDLGHKEQIGRLLLNYFDDHQIVITTHSKFWFTQLKDLAGGKFKQFEIRSWTPERGPVIVKHNSSEELINKYLSDEFYDPQAAGNACRRYLEYMLLESARINGFKLPFKDRYALGELFDNVRKSILKKVKKTSLKEYYTQVWGDIGETKGIANVLSHNNYEYYDVTSKDVESFVNDVFALRDSLICEDCGRFLRFTDDKIISCSWNKCDYMQKYEK